MFLIFSDLHMASAQNSRTVDDVCRVIEQVKPSKTVFVGDTVDFYADKDLAASMLSDLKLRIKGLDHIFLQGNHDLGVGQDTCTLNIAGNRYKFIHGHQYDDMAGWLDQLGTKLNEFFVTWLHINFQNIGRWLFSRSYPEGRFFPPLYRCRRKAILSNSNTDVLLIGHTHYLENTEMTPFFRFVNLGNWKNYTVINDDGSIEFEEFV